MYCTYYYICIMKTDFLKNWDTQLRKGILPYFVLKILKEKERYGYDLIQALKLQHDIVVTESTIYPLLIRLMNEDLLVYQWVEQTSGIPRKYYYISKLGKTTLTNMRKNLEDLLSAIQ